MFFLVFSAAVAQVAVVQTVYRYTEEPEKLTNVEGRTTGIRDRVNKDLVLGGLIPVHDYATGGVCGKIRRDQFVEAMLFAIDSVNANETLLPNISLGFDIRDTCFSDQIGLDEAIDVINGSRDSATPTVGIVGAGGSRVNMAVARVGRLYQIPQVSFSSTSPLLSNRVEYSFFYRTVPPDNIQTQTMIGIVCYFNWTQVALIYVEDAYGDLGAQEVRWLAMNDDICINVDREIRHSFTMNDFRELAKTLLASNADVVILFSRGQTTRLLFEAVVNSPSYRKFTWIASDGWARTIDLAHMFNQTVAGYFGVAPYAPHVPLFDEYLSQLTIQTNRRNAWFEEIFATFASCNLSNSCNQNISITSLPNYAQDCFVPPMIDAVYAFANALHNYFEENCNFTSGWTWKNQKCPGQKRELNGSTLLQYLRIVDFISPLTGTRVNFDSLGNAPGRYEILNYQAHLFNGVTHYDYKQVGTWNFYTQNGSNLEFFENVTFQFGVNHSGSIVYQPPIGQCGRCSEGEVYRPVASSCCGICEPTTDQPATSDQPVTCCFAVHVIGIACIIASIAT